MNVPVSRMAETGHADTVFLLQLSSKLEKRLEHTPRHGDVVVEFCQAGVPQRIGKLTTQRPEFLDGDFPKSFLDEQR